MPLRCKFSTQRRFAPVIALMAIFAWPASAFAQDRPVGTAGYHGWPDVLAQSSQDDVPLPPPRPGFRLNSGSQPGGNSGQQFGGNADGSGPTGINGRSKKRRPGRFDNNSPADTQTMTRPQMPGDRQSMPGDPGSGNQAGPNLLQLNPQDGAKRPGRPGGAGQAVSALDLRKLNLSDEQKQRIRKARSLSGVQAREVRKSLQAARMQLRDLMFDPAATDDQIRAKRREMRSLQDQLDDMRVEDFLSLRSVLTPEQRQHLPDIKPGGQLSAPAAAGGLTAPAGAPEPQRPTPLN